MIAAETLKIISRAGLHPPRTLTMAITGACNLACRHCWVTAGGNSAAAHVPERTLRRLLEEFVALGGDGVRFTGGEPLCHPAWLQLLQFGRALGLSAISLQTNGMLFTAETVDLLAELDFPQLRLQISLDGATAPAHDLVRGEGAYAGVMAGLRRLAQRGLAPQITIFFTEMRHNLEEFPALLQLAAELGIGAVVTGTLVRCGRAAAETDIAPPDLEQYLRLLQRFDTEPAFRELYQKIGTMAALEWRQETTPRGESCTFVENPYLTSTGSLYPCVLCHADAFAVSGVFGKNLAAAFAEGAPLWSTLLATSRRRAEANPSCQECSGRLVCAGGCLGRAWGCFHDLLAADDRCELRRTIYQQNKSLTP
jgi:radical SAM protein with 4Fe4S-binding SPASM domain